METVLGLLGMAAYIAATIGLAAGVTYSIVRISPSGRRAKNQKPKPTAT